MSIDFNLEKALASCSSDQKGELKKLLDFVEQKKIAQSKGNRSRLSTQQKLCLFIYVEIQKRTIPSISEKSDLTESTIYYNISKLRVYCKVLGIFKNKIKLQSKPFSFKTHALTENERYLLLLLVNGYYLWDIAQIKQVRLSSIEAQIRILYNKTGTTEMQALIACALKNGVAGVDGLNCCLL